RERAQAAGVRLDDVAAILVTHEHTDHSKGAAALAQELRVPVWASPGTLAALPEGDYEKRILSTAATHDVAGYQVDAFRVEHDARQPLGLRLRKGGRKVGYLTDTGVVTPAMARMLHACHLLVIESNHDVDLLTKGPYPEMLKRRIRGGRGHIDNDTCARFLQSVVTKDTQRVVLHHLSETNNTPELALATAHAILHRSDQVPPELLAAPPHRPLGP